MCDFNAKIGEEDTGNEEVMSRHGLGEMSDNGERCTDFCALNGLGIGGSIFPHERIHTCKVTWVSPENCTENQIDHISINKRFRRSFQDVRVRRGVDVASDHRVVITRVKLRLNKNPNVITRRQRYNVSLLRDNEKREEYQNRLKNKFQVLQELVEEDDIPMENQWRNVKEILNSTCKEVVDFRKHQRKEWISTETLKKIESRRKKKAIVKNSRTRYEDANKEVKRNIKTDKKNYSIAWQGRQKKPLVVET